MRRWTAKSPLDHEITRVIVVVSDDVTSNLYKRIMMQNNVKINLEKEALIDIL